MADGSTRRVIEVQSDLFQKGKPEEKLGASLAYKMDGKDIERTNELSRKKTLTTDEAKEFDALNEKWIEIGKKNSDARAKEIEKLSQYNDPTAHFRMIREEVSKAVEDGKKKLQFPTGETAMKIE